MAAILASASSGEVASSRPMASRSASATGQNVMPSPYGRQRPRSTRARSPSDVTISWVSRDLPTPAWPMTVTRRQAEPLTASWNAARIAASSFVRPTSGESNRPGVHPDARLDPDSPSALDVDVQSIERRLHVDRRPDRPEGVVLVDLWNA